MEDDASMIRGPIGTVVGLLPSGTHGTCDFTCWRHGKNRAHHGCEIELFALCIEHLDTDRRHEQGCEWSSCPLVLYGSIKTCHGATLCQFLGGWR